ncbi:MAG: hypothetical protein V4487_02210 [Chlamydiota bacterium]
MSTTAIELKSSSSKNPSYTLPKSAFVDSNCEKVSELATKYIKNGYQLYFIEQRPDKNGTIHYTYHPKLGDQAIELDKPLPKQQIAVLVEDGKIPAEKNSVAAHDVQLNGTIYTILSPTFGSYSTFEQVLSRLHAYNDSHQDLQAKEISVISTSTVKNRPRGQDFIVVESSSSLGKETSPSCVIS